MKQFYRLFPVFQKKPKEFNAIDGKSSLEPFPEAENKNKKNRSNTEIFVEQQESQESQQIQNRINPVDVNEKIQFLRQYTSNIPHDKKSFYQHLYHVGLFLHKCKERVALCDAGLYHSIYGTEFFNIPASHEPFKDMITREKIQSLIGIEAENIAFIFCSFKENRFLSILENSLNLDKEIHLDLCKLEFSNLLDQNDHHQLDNKLLALGQKIRELAQVCRASTHSEFYDLRRYQAS